MKTKKPLISIVITYYNKKKFIEKTLKSIRNQTYKNYELIFVFDNNFKEDLKFIKTLLKKFKRKKLIINKKNIGVASSRNKAIKFCKGSYIAFIDSDDIWLKNKLTYQINYMIKYSSSFSFTSYAVINEKSKILYYRKVIVDAKYENLIKSNFIGLSTVIINKKKISKIIFPKMKTQEDFGLWLQFLRKGYELNHIKIALSYWRKTKKSLSSNIFQKIMDAFKLFYIYENKNLIFSIYSVLVLSINKLIKKHN